MRLRLRARPRYDLSGAILINGAVERFRTMASSSARRTRAAGAGWTAARRRGGGAGVKTKNSAVVPATMAARNPPSNLNFKSHWHEWTYRPLKCGFFSSVHGPRRGRARLTFRATNNSRGRADEGEGGRGGGGTETDSVGKFELPFVSHRFTAISRLRRIFPAEFIVDRSRSEDSITFFLIGRLGDGGRRQSESFHNNAFMPILFVPGRRPRTRANEPGRVKGR